MTYIAIVLPAWKDLSRPFMEQRWNDGTQAVSLLTLCLIIFLPFFLSFNNLPGGQRLCWPEPTEENVVSAGGFGFLFASL